MIYVSDQGEEMKNDQEEAYNGPEVVFGDSLLHGCPLELITRNPVSLSLDLSKSFDTFSVKVYFAVLPNPAVHPSSVYTNAPELLKKGANPFARLFIGDHRCVEHDGKTYWEVRQVSNSMQFSHNKDVALSVLVSKDGKKWHPAPDSCLTVEDESSLELKPGTYRKVALSFVQRGHLTMQYSPRALSSGKMTCHLF
jgi:hypothetical protein